jgi:LmbE family N-acetylglucosaminyl deacetylase
MGALSQLIKLKKLNEFLNRKIRKFLVLSSISAKNVLVLAPHPDDEVFGCAGSLINQRKNGARISVVYFCRGDKGSKEKNNNLPDIRKKEAENSSRIIGIEKSFWLGNNDLELKQDKKNIDSLIGIIGKLKPDCVYLPSPFDPIPDHKATFGIFLEASKRINRNFKCAIYEIWAPLPINCIVDISHANELKTKAIKMHQSQIKELKFDEAILSLNRYRALIHGNKRKIEYAEGFVLIDSKETAKRL